MRKQTKLVAALSATALLAIGASMASFAATKGWVEEDGVWMYLDSDGEAVTEDWKKSGSQYFWLDENGEMATDKLIDDDDDRYYVDASGARVINSWRQVDNEDGWTNQEGDEEPAQVWYYFGSNGKAQTGKKTINGKTYFFDEDGEMFYSWYTHSTDKVYYLGDETEGYAYSGWHYLALREEDEDSGYDDEEYWFNFKSAGDMRAGKEGEISRAYISGSYYGFDENGVMVDGWKPSPVATDASPKNPNNVFYTEDNGNQPKGWVFTYTVDDWEDQDDDQQWYYLDSKGKPFNVGGSGSDVAAFKMKEGDAIDKKPSDDGARYTGIKAKYIKKETYLFGSDGVMLTGVMALAYDDGGGYPTADEGTAVEVVREGGAGNLKRGIYYFNKNSGSSLGQMETGKVTVNYDGENYYYNFRKKAVGSMSVGAAYTSAIVDGCLYDKYGKRVNADESREYFELTDSAFDFPLTDENGNDIVGPADGKGVIISSSGKVKKSGKVTVDGTEYTLADYVVTTIGE